MKVEQTVVPVRVTTRYDFSHNDIVAILIDVLARDHEIYVEQTTDSRTGLSVTGRDPKIGITLVHRE